MGTMNRGSLALAAFLVCAPGLGQAPPPSSVYSVAQAQTGANLYREHCADCHGAALEGLTGPALKGPVFDQMVAAQRWTAKTLNDVTALTMPQSNPGSLTAGQYAALTAYLLQQNGYPAGATALSANDERLSRIELGNLAINDASAQIAAPANTTHDATEDLPPPESIQLKPFAQDVTITDAMMRGAESNANDWLLYGRTYDNQRFSPLTQINPGNVKKLLPAAIVQTGIANSFEATPIVVNGVMFVSTPGDNVLAVDAANGELLWRYTPALGYAEFCCGPQSRGVAVGYGKVFVARLDGVVVALNARDGKVVWTSDAAATLPVDSTHFSFTLAPQLYDGMVIVGSSGAEFAQRGFVQAYDAATGKIVWRFRTIAAPGEPGGDSWSGDSWKTGGGSVWATPAVDVKNGLISFGVGNPNPDVYGDERQGDNAYTDSIVAVGAHDGKLLWWYQQVAHDLWDLDACGPVILLEVRDQNGRMVPAAAEAGKEGHVFIVNRLTGKLIRKSEPFVLESANKWTPPTSEPGKPHYPSATGGGQWSPSAYSPLTRHFYIMGINHAWTYTVDKNNPAGGQIGGRLGGEMRAINDGKAEGTIEPSGNLSAIDVDTGKISWQYHSEYPMLGGVLATAGNLIFSGEMNGMFSAFDAKTGKRLWQFNLGVGATAPPITYRVHGRQYVAVAAGGVSANGLQRLMADKGRPPFGDVIAIFAIPQ